MVEKDLSVFDRDVWTKLNMIFQLFFVVKSNRHILSCDFDIPVCQLIFCHINFFILNICLSYLTAFSEKSNIQRIHGQNSAFQWTTMFGISVNSLTNYMNTKCQFGQYLFKIHCDSTKMIRLIIALFLSLPYLIILTSNTEKFFFHVF